MTPDEKNAVLQFMGLTYGQSHKMDKDIVGESQFVKPISTTVKKAFEEVLNSNTNTIPMTDYQAAPPSYNESVNQHDHPTSQITPSNYIVENPPIIANNDTVKQLKTIAQQLSRVGDILESLTKTNNVRAGKKIKDTIEK